MPRTLHYIMRGVMHNVTHYEMHGVMHYAMQGPRVPHGARAAAAPPRSPRGGDQHRQRQVPAIVSLAIVSRAIVSCIRARRRPPRLAGDAAPPAYRAPPPTPAALTRQGADPARVAAEVPGTPIAASNHQLARPAYPATSRASESHRGTVRRAQPRDHRDVGIAADRRAPGE